MWRSGITHRSSRAAVVAQVDGFADFQPLADLDDRAPVVVGDPGPHAMQDDVVELRQVVARRQVGEAVVGEAGARPRLLRQRLRVGRVDGVEIGPPELHRRGGGVDVRRQALAETQFEAAAPRPLRRLVAADEQRHVDQRRRQLAIAVRIVDLGLVQSIRVSRPLFVARPPNRPHPLCQCFLVARGLSARIFSRAPSVTFKSGLEARATRDAR